MRIAALCIVLGVLTSGAAAAEPILAGAYVCDVEQRVGIGSTHLEGDAGAMGFVDEAPRYRFRMSLSDDGEAQRAVEAPYDGSDRSQLEWHTPNSTLHAPYVGADGVLRATGEEIGFLHLYADASSASRIRFYHSAFEYPGGEDTVVALRYGHCERE
jgi:hypothetical protein